MLRKIWKKMLWPLAFFLLTVLGILLSNAIADSDISGGIAALTLFILCPLTLISFVWCLIKAIKLTIRYKKGEDISYAFESPFQNLEEKQEEEKAEVALMDREEKVNYYLFRFGGYAIALLGLYVCIHFGIQDKTAGIVFGTLILIGGLTLRLFASSSSFNGSNGIVERIRASRPYSMEEIYEAFKDEETIWGSPYLGRFSTMKRPALVIGPTEDGELVYAYLSGDARTLYVSSTPFASFLKEKLAPQLHPAKEVPLDSLPSIICYSASALFQRMAFTSSLRSYLETGKTKKLSPVEPRHTYTFDENFKLTGQHFTLKCVEGEAIYHVDGTYPLMSFHIYDNEGKEVFSCTKEILNLLPTYRFQKDGEFFGTLSKKFDFYEDTFTMETEEGLLELKEIGGSIGHNYSVSLAHRNIGFILDDLSFTLRNFVFDNSVIVVEEKEDLPLMTALAIMVAREIQRDRNISYNSHDD